MLCPVGAFVAPAGLDPAAQVVRLTNTGSGTALFSVASDGTWLSPNPQRTSSAAGATAGIRISALSAGLYPDTRNGQVKVEPPGSERSDS